MNNNDHLYTIPVHHLNNNSFSSTILSFNTWINIILFIILRLEVLRAFFCRNILYVLPLYPLGGVPLLDFTSLATFLPCQVQKTIHYLIRACFCLDFWIRTSNILDNALPAYYYACSASATPATAVGTLTSSS